MTLPVKKTAQAIHNEMKLKLEDLKNNPPALHPIADPNKPKGGRKSRKRRSHKRKTHRRRR